MLLAGIVGLLFVVSDAQRQNWFYTGVVLAGLGFIVEGKQYWIKAALVCLGAVIMLIGWWLRRA